MSLERRRDAARRVRAAYPPLTVVFASLRAALGELDLAGAFAEGVAAARAAGVPDTGPLALSVPVAGAAQARSAGVVAAVRGTEWLALQRFGAPYCPRPACYGRNGSILTGERIAAEGFPPYPGGCNCSAEPAHLP